MIAIILAFGCMVAVSIYLLLDPNMIRKVIAILLLGSAINIAIFIAGRLDDQLAAFVEPNSSENLINFTSNLANPLPQALVLTAIVISFAMIIFLITLLKFSAQRGSNE